MNIDKNNNKKQNETDKKTDGCKEKIEELENQVKRTLADYKNLEKRVENQKRGWILTSNKQLLLNILPILDTLILASKHSKDQGLGLGIKQFLDILKKEGVEKIEVLGKLFDPNQMEAIDTVEGEEGKVVEEIRPGYRLYDQVLRAAQVRIGRGIKNN